MSDSATPSPRAIEVLKLLKKHHNVLVSGAPGTGKTRLLAEVRRWFLGVKKPGYDPKGAVVLPEAQAVTDETHWLPSPERSDRSVFDTVFHQGTKHRDFIRGLVPSVGGSGLQFRVSEGTLYRASQQADKEDGAALVLIDEINRGPAVQIFGDTIVAIESDKRLAPDGTPTATTHSFELLNDEGVPESKSLSHHLYLLAAMNQADTSVEPLDVAFLRRWYPYVLQPNEGILVEFFGVEADLLGEPLNAPESAADVYRAAIQAWSALNARIALGRGQEYRIGHGVLMGENEEPPQETAAALSYIEQKWQVIQSHLEEVFFGDVAGLGEALGVGAPGNPYSVEETFFGESAVVRLKGPESLTGDLLYKFLQAAGSSS